MSKLMPCDFCKELYEAIELESVGPAMVACDICKAHHDAKRRANELEIMRSRGDL